MNSLVVTNDGHALMTRLIAGTATCKFTKVEISDHTYTASELEALSELADVKQTEDIAEVSVVDNSYVKAAVRFENSKLEEGYYIRTLGVFAKDLSNNSEILYAVSIADDNPDYMPAFGGKTSTGIQFNLSILVNNSDNVTVEVSQAATPTLSMFEELKTKVDNLSFTARNVSYDSTGSKLGKDNVQDAIDILASSQAKDENNIMAVAAAVQLHTMTEIPGLSGNICVETFSDASGISLASGSYNSTEKYVYA